MKLNKQRIDLEGIAGGERPPLLDPSKEYRAGTVKMEKAFHYKWGEKLYVHFELLDFPHEKRPVLYRAYNVSTPQGSGSDLFQDCEFIRGKRIKKNAPINYEKVFKNKVFIIKVKTMTTNSKGRVLPEDLHWSIVDEIVRVEVFPDEEIVEKEVTELKNTQNEVKDINPDECPF